MTGVAPDSQLRDLVDWLVSDHDGRIGRLLIVLQLMQDEVLTEPELTLSPWFEARRADHDDRLFAVSARGDWDSSIGFFARGPAASARATERQLTDLLRVQADLESRVRAAGLRADRAMLLVDRALEQPIVTVRQVERRLGVSCTWANGLVSRLVEAGVIDGQLRGGGVGVAA